MSDQELMDRARKVALSSPDRSRKVGCVIVTVRGKVIEGFNTFPSGVKDTDARHERPEKYFWIEHAERNAIYRAARRGESLYLGTAYLPWFPCMDCARALIQSGVSELVAVEPDLADPKWGEDFKRVETLLNEGGVRVRFLCE